MKRRMLNPKIMKLLFKKTEALKLISNLSQINDELDRRTNSIGDTLSENFQDVRSNQN